MKYTNTPVPAASRIILDRALLVELARHAPLRLFAQTMFEWLCIAALIHGAIHFKSAAADALCILLIATRQHALLALMHEYAHYQLSRKRKGWNDLVGDVFTAFPFFITVHGFRRNHMQHHRSTSTEHDPNWVSSLRKARYQFPMSSARFWWETFKHCVGCYTLEELKGYTVDAGMAVALPRAVHAARAVFIAVAAGLLTGCGGWTAFLLYWIVPMATFLMAILYIRDVGEHFGMPSPGMESSRTVKASWLERVLISQNGVNFHAEHHLYPSVPFFRLGRLHDALAQQRAYLDKAVVTQGYLSGLVREVTARRQPA